MPTSAFKITTKHTHLWNQIAETYSLGAEMYICGYCVARNVENIGDRRENEAKDIEPTNDQ